MSQNLSVDLDWAELRAIENGIRRQVASEASALAMELLASRIVEVVLKRIGRSGTTASTCAAKNPLRQPRNVRHGGQHVTEKELRVVRRDWKLDHEQPPFGPLSRRRHRSCNGGRRSYTSVARVALPVEPGPWCPCVAASAHDRDRVRGDRLRTLRRHVLDPMRRGIAARERMG